jgi:hypothetical protein
MQVLTLPSFPVSVLGTVVNKRARYSYLRKVDAAESLTYRCEAHTVLPARSHIIGRGRGTPAGASPPGGPSVPHPILLATYLSVRLYSECCAHRLLLSQQAAAPSNACQHLLELL